MSAAILTRKQFELGQMPPISCRKVPVSNTGSNKREPMALQTEVTKGGESGWRETIKTIAYALIIAIVIRAFFFEPFNIPSGSMKETLLVGDYLFVSKLSYGYSHYSLPLSPHLFSGRIWSGTPERGDIVVFRLPKDDSTD